MFLRIKPSHTYEFYDQKDAHVTTKLIKKSDCLKFREDFSSYYWKKGKMFGASAES